MTRYLTWRNIFGVLLLAILVMIWPLELIGWYSVTVAGTGSGTRVLKTNAITGHLLVWEASADGNMKNGTWIRAGW